MIHFAHFGGRGDDLTISAVTNARDLTKLIAGLNVFSGVPSTRVTVSRLEIDACGSQAICQGRKLVAVPSP